MAIRIERKRGNNEKYLFLRYNLDSFGDQLDVGDEETGSIYNIVVHSYPVE